MRSGLRGCLGIRRCTERGCLAGVFAGLVLLQWGALGLTGHWGFRVLGTREGPAVLALGGLVRSYAVLF